MTIVSTHHAPVVHWEARTPVITISYYIQDAITEVHSHGSIANSKKRRKEKEPKKRSMFAEFIGMTINAEMASKFD